MSQEQYYNRSSQDYLNILKRQKYWILLPALGLLAISTLIAFALPAIYESEAVILIEEQEVPSELVTSTMTSFADQRIQVVSRRVLTVENISAIIRKYGMYGFSGNSSEQPGAKLAVQFRKNVRLDMVSAEVVNPRSGRPSEATIAFTLAFKDSSPEIAQHVADDLARLFLRENQRERTEQASSAAEFLADEAEEINAELLGLEQRLADFKIANEGSLPESYQYNLSTLDGARQELSAVDVQRQELLKRKIELEGKKSQLSPSAPVVLATGDVVMSDVDRLKALQAEYRSKAAVYNQNHPDIIRLQREIETLQQELGVGVDVSELQRQLSEQRQRLADLLAKYNENHSEVKSARRVIAQLEDNIRAADAQGSQARAPVADNPAYILLQTEIDALGVELSTLSRRERELRDRIVHYESLIRRTPEVEQGYKALLRDYENATAEYQEVKAKQRKAQSATQLEKKQKGQRFVLIQPPILPSDPVSPNRPAIILLGFLLGSGAGSGIALLREFMDRAVHGVDELTAIMGEAPLVAIPYIYNDVEVSQRQRVWKGGAVLLIGGLLAAIVGYFLVFVM